jgi:UDP-N-acetylmuramyl pentapeptide phosphotransferase/UDP-N-acetylglucosamine-1-phosphate transferase
MIVLVAILGTAASWLVTSRVTAHLAAGAPLHARNYRGLEIPAACGMAVVLGLLAGAAAVALPLVRRDAVAAVASFAVVAVGFGLLGLWDDIATVPHERGWKVHLAALGRGTPTTGAIKLVGGAAFAFVVTAPSGLSFWRTLHLAALIAMSANLFNLLDVRPGRAGKFALVAIVPCLVASLAGGSVVWVPLLVLAAAIGSFLPFDLRERAMLGDVGANAIGAAVGAGVITTGSFAVELAVLVVLVAAHLVADKPGLSRLIDATPPLAALDKAGRVHG